MKTDLALSHLAVAPGTAGRVQIEVTNTSDVIDGVTAIVDGINPDWVRLERPVVSLFPDSSDQIGLVLDIPADCPAGDYLVIVRIVSTIDIERETAHDFWLTVHPLPGLDLDLRPAIVTGGSEAAIEATIHNTGNSTIEVSVVAIEPTREVDCTVDPATFTIPQGDEAMIDVIMRGPRPWFGEPQIRSIQITATTGDVVVEKMGTFRQKARIPRGLITALILASIVLLWALIFLFVVSELRRGDPPAKVVGADFVTGPENIPLTAIAATVEGKVTASTTGAGVPRITVEALRVTADGSLRPVGSAATDDDGMYSLKSLIPGKYLLRFSADGYSEIWYPSSPSQTGAESVALDPRTVSSGIDVVLTGATGRLLGNITPPPGAPDVPLTVTATLVDGVSNPDDPDALPFSVTIETANGEIDLGGLPTPGTYQVTVTGDGFQTQQFEQTLDGGQASVINTVGIIAANGSITGIVQDRNGTRLGGVFVTARSGDTEFNTITPTAGNVGQFTLSRLVTPETYVLTFAQPGASSTTAALSLSAGENRSGVIAELVSGNGTVTGTIVSATGDALGGITVTVLGDGFTSETSTLTTSGTAGGPGSFTVSGIPVPGNYTVSVSSPTLLTETLGVNLQAAGEQSVGTVTMLAVNGVVRGTVSGPSGGLGGATVVLSDGTQRTRTTTSATNPAGAYAFADTPAGSYTVTVSANGVATKVVLVSVDAGGTTQQNISLTAAG